MVVIAVNKNYSHSGNSKVNSISYIGKLNMNFMLDLNILWFAFTQNNYCESSDQHFDY